MEPQNEELDIIDRLVEVKDGYEFGEEDNERGRLHQAVEVKGNLRRNLDFWIHIGAPKFCQLLLMDIVYRFNVLPCVLL